MWSRVRSWLRAVTKRSRMESEMDAELRFHIDTFAEGLIRSMRSRFTMTSSYESYIRLISSGAGILLLAPSIADQPYFGRTTGYSSIRHFK